MDDLGTRGETIQPASGAVIKTCTDADQQIGSLHGLVGRQVAMHAEHAQIIGMAGRNRADALECRYDGDATGTGIFAERIHGPGDADAAARIQDRTLRLLQQPAGKRELLRIRSAEVRRLHLEDRRNAGHGVGHVLGQIHQHRPRAALGGDVEGLTDDPRDIFGAADQEAVFHDRHRDAEDVHFLERVCPHYRCRHLSSDSHYRHRVHESIGDACHQVGGAGAGRGHTDAGLAGHPGEAVGRQHCTLLVAGQHMPDRRVEQGIVDRHDRPSRIPEDHPDALLFEGFHQ